MEEQILAVDLSTEQTLEVNLPEQDNVAQIDVYWQDEVVLDLDASLMYIVSGQQEIQDYVENTSKPEINRYIDEYAKPIVSEVVDQIATPVIDEYFENTVKPSITEFAEEEMAGYAATATEQAGIATEKANEASETAKIVDEKVQEFGQTTETSKTEFVNFAQEKTEEFEQTAEQATNDSRANVEKSRIWAEGEQAEVKLLGGELSSKGWALQASNSATSASQSATQAKTSETNAKSYADSINPDRFLNKKMITNCITEIPQDIKLELSNGTLTLKAGSKVYVPNGAGKFDVVNVSSDITRTETTNGQYYLVLNPADNYLNRGALPATSGTTAPSSTTIGTLWYDTTNNVIKRLSSSGLWSSMSLPLCIYTVSNGAISSIDQVFNGFGYIGSTVFALPGVKGLIPNGRNEDGSLKNIEFTTHSVLITTNTGSTDTRNITLDGDSIDHPGSSGYVEAKNRVWRAKGDGTQYYETLEIIAGQAVYSAGKITSFTPKLPFHAVDRNDSSWISAQGMPSSKYIDLTLGATGTRYTAPASGRFCLVKKATGGGQSIDMSSNGLSTQAISTASGQAITAFAPAAKGESVVIYYTTGGATNSFRFIYAKGEI